MRTKIRYVFLFGSAFLLLCFLYLHSSLNGNDELKGHEAEGADFAWKRKPYVPKDTKVNHIFQEPQKEEDAFHLNGWAREKADAPDTEDDVDEGDGDEDSELPSLNDEEKARVRNKGVEDTLPRPDADHLGQGKKEQPKKRPVGAIAKKTAGMEPVGDPVANFHWNKRGRGGGSDLLPVATVGKCMPRENITFLKVHKTGSSTVQNIFLRYGDLHELAFVLPMMGHHLGYPNFFEKRHMLKTKNGMYNIFCHHARFSNEVREVMPRNTIYISILRDPVKVFESAFSYFKLDMRMKMTGEKDAMKIFLSNPKKYYADFPNKIHSRNGMLFDFGVPQTEFDNLPFIKRAISVINDQFELIMIAEYFEESLILMKDLLCWTLEEVIVFNQNARNSDSVQDVDLDMRSKIQAWNSGDMLLYDFFNRTLWQRIERYGRERMEQDKAALQKKTKYLFDKCIATDSAPREQGDFKVWQPPGVNINAFVLKPGMKGNKLCESMVKPEIQYTTELKVKQFPDVNFAQLRQMAKAPKNPLVKRVQP